METMGCSSRQLARLIAVFIVVFLITGVIAVRLVRASAHRAMMECFLTSCSVPAGTGPGQDIYKARLRGDEQSLDRGVLTYSPMTGLKAAAVTQFKVVVTDIGRGAQRTKLAKSNGMDVYQQDVPTGGAVSVQIVGCEDITCQQESALKQLVLTPGSYATWDWQITAGKPGLAKLIVRLDTYDRNSGQTLHEEMFPINVQVIPTAALRYQQRRTAIISVVKAISQDVVTIGSMATAILAVGGVMGWVMASRRNRSNSNRGGKGNRGRPLAGRNRRRQASDVLSCADRRLARRLVR
jgi:hypothetical protein